MVKALPVMADHVQALRGLLEGNGWSVYVGDVDAKNPPMPYALIQAVTGVGGDVNVAQDRVEVAEDVNVTVVDDSASNCLRSTSECRAVLNGAVLTVAGRRCFPMRLTAAQPVAVDRDVTLTGTDRHPCYAVDSWRLSSTPLED